MSNAFKCEVCAAYRDSVFSMLELRLRFRDDEGVLYSKSFDLCCNPLCLMSFAGKFDDYKKQTREAMGHD